MTTILIMEDDAAVREGYVAVLEAAGYQTFAAYNGVAGMAILKQQPIDLIISDGEMPGMSGFEVLAEIKRHPQTAYIPFIMISGSSPQQVAGAFLKNPPDLYLTKPVKVRELLTAVAQLVGASR